MFQFVCKKFLPCRSAFALLRNQDLGFLQLHHFSTSSQIIPKSDSSEEDNRLFPINYLTCGLSPTEFESMNPNSQIRQRPGSVISFLRNQRSIHPDTAEFIKDCPPIHRWDSVKSLLPRIEYFMSIGLSTHDIAFMGPDVIERSLEKEIIPLYKYITSVFPSHADALVCFKRLCLIQLFDLENVVIPNISYLRRVGVSCENVVKILVNHPYAISFKPDHLKKAVNEVKSMWIHPKLYIFPMALFAVGWNSESEWRKKVEIYESFGIPYTVLREVFRKFPFCMVHSADKILKTMDFLVNGMGFEPCFVMEWPPVFYHSLEEWIVPRCVVYEALLGKDLVPRIENLMCLLKRPEEDFLSTFVDPFKAQIPGLMMMYNQKRATCLVEAKAEGKKQ